MNKNEAHNYLILSYNYYPFGSVVKGRSFSSSVYRYGFNGMEKDNEVSGEGNDYTTENRAYDSRLGRWFSVDPAVSKYPGWSPYVFVFDNPIWLNDPKGDDPPTIKEIYEKGKQSPRFNALLKGSQVNDANYNKIITFGSMTGTDPDNGMIYIKTSYDAASDAVGLAHELNNRANLKTFVALQDKVKKGELTPESYAAAALEIEAVGIVNQIIVAAELNITIPGMEKFVDAYKTGAIDEAKMTAGLKKYISLAKTESGQTGEDYHKEAAKDMRKDYLEQHKDDKKSETPKNNDSKENKTKEAKPKKKK